jgi:hypothetical protein
MGLYVNHNSAGMLLPANNKADYLLLDGGEEIPEPKEFVQNLICVIENGPFDAALYCYKKSEMDIAKNPQDSRPKRWIIYPYAAEITRYRKL